MMKVIKSSLLVGCTVLPMIGSYAYSKEYKAGWHKPNSFDMSTDQLRMYDNVPFNEKNKVKVITKPVVTKKVTVKPNVVSKAFTPEVLAVKITPAKIIKTSMEEYYESHRDNHLAEVRGQLLEQWNNPKVRAAVQARIEIEVGSQGEQAHQAFLETVANRAIARYDGNLIKTVNNHDGYYPTKDNSKWKINSSEGLKDELEVKYKNVGLRVFNNASNITRYGTGNASGSVSFGGGPQTLKTGGEKFGIEAPDLGWHKSIIQAKN